MRGRREGHIDTVGPSRTEAILGSRGEERRDRREAGQTEANTGSFRPSLHRSILEALEKDHWPELQSQRP